MKTYSVQMLEKREYVYEFEVEAENEDEALKKAEAHDVTDEELVESYQWSCGGVDPIEYDISEIKD